MDLQAKLKELQTERQEFLDELTNLTAENEKKAAQNAIKAIEKEIEDVKAEIAGEEKKAAKPKASKEKSTTTLTEVGGFKVGDKVFFINKDGLQEGEITGFTSEKIVRIKRNDDKATIAGIGKIAATKEALEGVEIPKKESKKADAPKDDAPKDNAPKDDKPKAEIPKVHLPEDVSYNKPLPKQVIEGGAECDLNTEFVIVEADAAGTIEMPTSYKAGDRLLVIKDNRHPVTVLEKGRSICRNMTIKGAEPTDKKKPKYATSAQVENLKEQLEDLQNDLEHEGVENVEAIKVKIETAKELMEEAKDGGGITANEAEAIQKAINDAEQIGAVVAETNSPNTEKSATTTRRPKSDNVWEKITSIDPVTAQLSGLVEAWKVGASNMRIKKVIQMKSDNRVYAEVLIKGAILNSYGWIKVCTTGDNDPVLVEDFDPRKDEYIIRIGEDRMNEVYRNGASFKSCRGEVYEIYKQCYADGKCSADEIEKYKNLEEGCRDYARIMLAHADEIRWLHKAVRDFREQNKDSKKSYYNAYRQIRNIGRYKLQKGTKASLRFGKERVKA